MKKIISTFLFTALMAAHLFAQPNVVAESNSPVCVGSNIELTETGTDAVGWLWSGPDGFSSTDNSPIISNATLSMSGSYIVTISDSDGNIASDTIDVEVKEVPNLVITDPPTDVTVDLTDPSVTIGSTGGTSSAKIDESMIFTSASLSTMTWSGDKSPEETIDNDTSTAFNAQPRNFKEANLIFELDAIYDITKIEVTTGDSTVYSGKVEIHLSPDNSEGSYTLGGEFVPAANSMDEISLTNASGKYVKLVVINKKDKDYWDIVEVDFYGKKNPFTYWKDDQATIPVDDPKNIDSTGTYYIKMDNGACSDIKAVNVTTVDITAIAGSNSPICEGEDIMLTETGGDAASWSWTGPNGYTSTDKDPVISAATTASSGIYTVEITDAGGYKIKDSVDVVVNEVPIADAGNDQIICSGESITITATGGDTYEWSNGEDTDAISVSPTVDSTYKVTVTTAAGCKDTTSVFVTVNEVPSTTDITGNATPTCEETGVSYTVDLTAGSSYDWSVPVGANIVSGETGTDNNEIVVDFGTIHGDITVVETNSSGCVGSAKSLSISLSGCELIADFTSDVTTVCSEDTVTFLNRSSGVSDSTTYSWDFGTGATPSTATGAGPHMVVYSDAGASTVSLELSDSATKTETKTDYITVYGYPTISDKSSSDPTDCGVDDGTITITASATRSLEYSVDGSNWDNTTGQFTDLSGGNYTVEVRESGSTECITSSETISLTSPSIPKINNVESTDPTKCSVEDGSITIVPKNSDNLEYTLNGTEWTDTSATFNNLSVGKYIPSIRVKGTINCVAEDDTVTLSCPVGGNFSLTVENGSGTGEYPVDTTFEITADTAPEGKVFDAWVGDTAYVANINNATTSVTMPAKNITLTATYSVLINMDNSFGTAFQVNCAPNPTEGHINVMVEGLNLNTELSINIYNIAGDLLKSSLTNYSGNTIELNLSDLSPAVYVMQVKSENYVSRERIIVQ